MFDYFVPPQLSMVPAAQIAQAMSSRPKILKPFTFCQDVESGASNSTANRFTVLRSNEWNSIERAINHNNKVRLIQPPLQGKIFLSDKVTPFTVGDTETGINAFMVEYTPTENYIGKDRAVFEVEANNKKYRVIVNFWVMPTVFDDGQGDTNCKKEKFGLTDNSTQRAAAWQQSANLSAFLAAASGVTYSFTNIPAKALGQTTGEGSSAQITLEKDAAGHSWYVDPTPLDSTDNYLPTSQSTVWQAKAGSASAEMTPTAEVKKDSKNMLNVLKVEHRLKYLGFPAMKTGAENTIKDFSVDGIFDTKETAAFKLFEKVVRYESSGNSARYAPASTGADGLIESGSAGQAKITKDWLNAYNAPH